MITLLLSVAASLGVGQEKRAPVPPPAELKKAEAELRGLFAAGLGTADRESRRILAGRLVQQGTDAANTPAARYAALGMARNLALEAMDLRTALSAVDATRAAFEVGQTPLAGATFKSDEKAARILALNDAQKHATTPRDIAELGEAYFFEAESALKEKAWEDAKSCAKMAERYGKSAKAASVLEKATSLAKDIPEREKESEAFGKLLETRVDDAPAKLIKGRYLLFVMGDETTGIAVLSGASDERVAKAATLEAAKPADSKGRMELAEAWIAASEKESTALHKRRYLDRGSRWMQEAARSAEGLDAVRVEKRIEELSAKSGLMIPWTDLLPLINPKKHAREGEWQGGGGAGVFCAAGSFAKLEVPYEPPDEYDVRMTVEPTTKTEALLMGVFRGRSFGVALYFGDGRVAIHQVGPSIEGKRVEIPPGRPTKLLLQVRLRSISVTVNDVLCHEWMPNAETVMPSNFWTPKNPKALGLGLNGPKATFTRLQIVDVTGRGRRLP